MKDYNRAIPWLEVPNKSNWIISHKLSLMAFKVPIVKVAGRRVSSLVLTVVWAVTLLKKLILLETYCLFSKASKEN